MPLPSDDNNLTGHQTVTVILRLVLDQRGQLEYGELVDVDGTAPERFIGWRGLVHSLQGWLTQQKKGNAFDHGSVP